MSSSRLRSGRKRNMEASVEPATPKGVPVTQQAVSSDISGFQLSGNQVNEILRRLDMLERERASVTAGRTISVSPVPQVVPLDKEIFRRLDALERERSSIATGSTISDPSITQAVPSVTTNNTICARSVAQVIPREDSLIGSSSRQALSTVSEREMPFLIHSTVTKPTFNGRNETNPMRFMDKLKKYINSVKGQDRAIDIATECVTGIALRRLELYSRTWESFADFERDFQKTFWGNKQQEQARYKLIHSSWCPKSEMTMSEHFAAQIDTVRSLTIPLSESDIVNSVMRHFPVGVQRLWFTQKLEATIPSAADFLSNIEDNVVEDSNEVAAVNSVRGKGRGRGNFTRVNSMNFAQTSRGSNYRRNQSRGRYNYRGNRRGNVPAIKWEWSKGGTTISNETNSASTQVPKQQISSANQGNEQSSSEIASAVRQ